MSATELVDCGKDIMSVAQTCRLLGVPRSSYYAARHRKPSRRALADAVLRVHGRAG